MYHLVIKTCESQKVGINLLTMISALHFYESCIECITIYINSCLQLCPTKNKAANKPFWERNLLSSGHSIGKQVRTIPMKNSIERTESLVILFGDIGCIWGCRIEIYSQIVNPSTHCLTIAAVWPTITFDAQWFFQGIIDMTSNQNVHKKVFSLANPNSPRHICACHNLQKRIFR